MKALNADTQAFVEQMGLMMDRAGGARTLGRLFGLLLAAQEPLSLGDMATLLQVSKASISTNARRCQQVGLVHRVSKPGDRRDYYEISPGSFSRMLDSRVAGVLEDHEGPARAGSQQQDENKACDQSSKHDGSPGGFSHLGSCLVATPRQWTS